MFVLAIGAMHMWRSVGIVPVIMAVPMRVSGMTTVAAVVAIRTAFGLEGL
jgi:hypothetical protein